MSRFAPTALLLGVLAGLVGTPAHAGSFDVALGGEASWVNLGIPVMEGRFELSPSWLHHEDNGDVASLGFLRIGARSSGPGIRAGLGVRAFYIDDGVEDGWALGIGGHAHYPFPGNRGFGLGVRAYFAPDVAAFGDADKYIELAAMLTYEVFEDAEVSIGYQFAEAQFDNRPDADLDSGVLFGFRLGF